MATNVKTRIELTDTRESMILKMSDGIPGAMTVLSAMVRNEKLVDPDTLLPGITAILNLDTLGIYSHRIWMFYSDVCKKDLVATIGLLRANQLGILPASVLHHAIDSRGKGVDVSEIVAAVRKQLPEFGKAYEEAKAKAEAEAATNAAGEPMSNGNGTKQKCPVCKRRIRGSNHENGHHHQEALAKQRK